MGLCHGVDGGDKVPRREGTHLLQITRGWVAKLRPKPRCLRAHSTHTAVSGRPRLLLRSTRSGSVLTCGTQRSHSRHCRGPAPTGPALRDGGLAPPPLRSPPGLRGPFPTLPFFPTRKREAWQSEYAERPRPAWLQSPHTPPLYHPGPPHLRKGCGEGPVPRGRASSPAGR